MKKLYFLLCILLLAISSQAQVVISQVYGGGGNSGAPFTNDFIELFNRGSVAQDLTGWSVQYASSTGTTWQVTNLTNVILAPGKYYLIQQAAGSNPSTTLPTPDATGTIAMSGTNGKVLLANVITAQTGANPSGSQIIDFVGFGSANAYEGTAATAVLSNTTAAIRLNGGCTDNNQNSNDFTTGTPTPRNSSTTANVCSNSPSLAISSPSSGSIFSPITTSANISLSISNFVVGNPGAGIDGHIHFTLNSGSVVMKYDTAPIALTSLTPGNYTVYVELVNNSHEPISPAVNATVTFTIAAYNVVADLAALRADVVANGAGKYYQVSSNPVITYARSSTYRNQKYIQDSGAGILIDDVPGTISTTMVAGDAISGLKGQTSLFNGVLQLLPLENATVASSGNIITPQVVTAADISANIEMYESKLVQINNASFSSANGTVVFATNTNNNLNDGSAIVFRTMFVEADYIGQVIPSGAANRLVLVAEFNGTAQVVARSLADVTLSVDSFNSINGFATYPNPVTNNSFTITSNSAEKKGVDIFNVLGKKVLSTTFLGTKSDINVASISSGIYILKVSEGSKTSTSKLVIQ